MPEATTIRLELSTVLAVLAKEREVVRDRARNWGHGGFYKSESTHFLYAGIIWDECNKDMFCGAASGLITYLTMESGRRINLECSCLRSLWRWWEKYTWTEKKWIEEDEGEAVNELFLAVCLALLYVVMSDFLLASNDHAAYNNILLLSPYCLDILFNQHLFSSLYIIQNSDLKYKGEC